MIGILRGTTGILGVIYVVSSMLTIFFPEAFVSEPFDTLVALGIGTILINLAFIKQEGD